MAIVVVGGHTRNIGKTSVVAGLIRALEPMGWTAFKITQFGHGVCSADGEACDCETADHTIAISEERARGTGTDSSRYLDAGAKRAYWVRTRQGQLAEAMPKLRRMLEPEGNYILESNSVLRFLKPDVFVSVLDPGTADFKESAKYYLDRADAVVLTGGLDAPAKWAEVSPRLYRRARQFTGLQPEYCSEALVEFVAGRLRALEP